MAKKNVAAPNKPLGIVESEPRTAVYSPQGFTHMEIPKRYINRGYRIVHVERRWADVRIKEGSNRKNSVTFRLVQLVYPKGLPLSLGEVRNQSELERTLWRAVVDGLVGGSSHEVYDYGLKQRGTRTK